MLGWEDHEANAIGTRDFSAYSSDTPREEKKKMTTKDKRLSVGGYVFT